MTLPPCLWSDEDSTLDKTVWLPADTPLFSIKKNLEPVVSLSYWSRCLCCQKRGHVSRPLTVTVTLTLSLSLTHSLSISLSLSLCLSLNLPGSPQPAKEQEHAPWSLRMLGRTSFQKPLSIILPSNKGPKHLSCSSTGNQCFTSFPGWPVSNPLHHSSPPPLTPCLVMV